MKKMIPVTKDWPKYLYALEISIMCQNKDLHDNICYGQSSGSTWKVNVKVNVKVVGDVKVIGDVKVKGQGLIVWYMYRSIDSDIINLTFIW